jgi:hypothetical protein
LSRDRHPPYAVLVVEILSDSPVPLATVAELLTALSHDYQQFSGCDLAIVDIRQGSLLATLRDFADLADKANHLYDFAKHIVDLIRGAIAGTAILRGRRRRNGSQTVIALAETALREKVPVRIVHKRLGKEELMVEVMPDQAFIIAHVSATPPFVREHPKTPAPADVDVESLGRLAQLAATDQAEGVMILVRNLVEIIRRRPDGRKLLADVAHGLKAHGYDAAAKLIEA